MSSKPISFDWNQLRAFIATVETGSITAAAASLGLTQPTLSRQISALEARLGVTLMERGPRAIVLTTPGESLLRDAEEMRSAAERISLSASEHTTSGQGVVSITASEAICLYRLPPIVAELQELAPGIELNILSENSVSNLMRREADIAIRHTRPEQPDLIAKVVLDSKALLYGSTDYLESRGRPRSIDDLADQNFIGPNTGAGLSEILNSSGVPIGEDRVKIVSNSWAGCWELVKSGLGLSLMMQEVGDATPNVEPILPENIYQPMTYWLVAHRELRNNPRIRMVYDTLAAHLTP